MTDDRNADGWNADWNAMLHSPSLVIQLSDLSDLSDADKADPVKLLELLQISHQYIEQLKSALGRTADRLVEVDPRIQDFAGRKNAVCPSYSSYAGSDGVRVTTSAMEDCERLPPDGTERYSHTTYEVDGDKFRVRKHRQLFRRGSCGKGEWIDVPSEIHAYFIALEPGHGLEAVDMPEPSYQYNIYGRLALEQARLNAARRRDGIGQDQVDNPTPWLPGTS